jgi:succinate dehydrogenase hydrophobic anchor subunit
MTNNQIEAIKTYMVKTGVTHFVMQPANGCIMVTYGRVCMYFIFNGDTIVDVQVD